MDHVWLGSCLLHQLAKVLKAVVSCFLGSSHQGGQTTGPREILLYHGIDSSLVFSFGKVLALIFPELCSGTQCFYPIFFPSVIKDMMRTLGLSVSFPFSFPQGGYGAVHSWRRGLGGHTKTNITGSEVPTLRLIELKQCMITDTPYQQLYSKGSSVLFTRMKGL